MSVFSKIKLSKKAAKAHKAAEANKENEAPKPAYRHVPQHAAADAMSGCPQAWVDQNRDKIVEHNKRASRAARQVAAQRREQAASRASSIRSERSGKSVGGISHKSTESRIVLDNMPKNRTQNAYFQTFPSESMNASIRSASVGKELPRNRSSQSFVIGTYHGSSYGSTTRMKRGLSYQDSAIGRSPLSSQLNSTSHSRVNSSGNSTASSEDLEMAGPSSSRSRPQLQSRYTISGPSGIKRNTSDPKISSSLRTSVMNADSLPTAPAPAVVKRGPMPVAPQQQPAAPVVAEKQKRRISIFGSKKNKAVAITA